MGYENRGWEISPVRSFTHSFIHSNSCMTIKEPNAVPGTGVTLADQRTRLRLSSSLLSHRWGRKQTEQRDRKNTGGQGKAGRAGWALGTGDRKQAAKKDSSSEGAAQVTQKNCLPSRGKGPKLLQSDPRPVREITPPLICILVPAAHYLAAHHPLRVLKQLSQAGREQESSAPFYSLDRLPRFP